MLRCSGARRAAISPWLVPVIAFIAVYLWRPLRLGFYSDDWSSLIDPLHEGSAFSFTRLSFIAHKLTYSRPLQILQQYVCTSTLGRSTVAWHVLMAVLVAVSCLMLRRFLLALGTSSAVATVASGVWLILPWTLGYTAWPVASCILLSLICFLAACTSLLRMNIWAGVAWFAASMMLYEAFYLQIAVVVVILLASPATRRRILTRAVPALVILQLAFVAGNRLAASMQPKLHKTYDASWPINTYRSLRGMVGTLADAFVGNHIVAVCAVVAGALAVFASALIVRNRDRDVRMVASLFGLVLAVIVVNLAGYHFLSVGKESRTLVAPTLWMVTFAALAWPVTKRHPKFVKAVGWLAIVVCLFLGVSTVMRTASWARWWTGEQKVLAAVPVQQLKGLDDHAVVLAVDLPRVDGIAVFDDWWGMSTAVGDRYPSTRYGGISRVFTETLRISDMSWDGQNLYRHTSVEMQGTQLWLWRWPQKTFERVTTTGQLH